MPARNPKEVFLNILSHLRHVTERSAGIYNELGDAAQNPEVKEALAARAFVSQQDLQKLDEVFKLIGEKPVQVTGRLQDVFVEDFRRELGEIQSPEGKRLFVLARANQLNHMRTAEYVTLVAAADLSGNFGAGVLLESCLADHLAFTERTRRLIRNIAEARIAARAST